jgi:hypothetical protein
VTSTLSRTRRCAALATCCLRLAACPAPEYYRELRKIVKVLPAPRKMTRPRVGRLGPVRAATEARSIRGKEAPVKRRKEAGGGGVAPKSRMRRLSLGPARRPWAPPWPAASGAGGVGTAPHSASSRRGATPAGPAGARRAWRRWRVAGTHHDPRQTAGGRPHGGCNSGSHQP